MWRCAFLVGLCALAVWLRGASPRVWAILLVAVPAILFMTLFGREALPEPRAILQPFHALASIWGLRWRRRGRWMPYGLMGNVLLFVPLGLGLSGRGAAWRKWWLAPAIVSLAVECAQYRTTLGTFEVDDVVCNAVAGMLGYELGRCLGGEKMGSLVVPAAYFAALGVCCAKSIVCN